MLRAVQRVTTNGNLDVGEDVVLIDASSQNITFTLPNITDVEGRFIIINRIDTSGNTVTIEPFSALQTLNGNGVLGQTSITLAVGEGRAFISDMNLWYYN